MNQEHRVLILFAHPALQKSRVNRALADAVRNLPGVTFHDLYERYPEFDVDVAPALVKEWEDLVLEHGWAYGSTGTALHGKIFAHAVTTGGAADAYRDGGFNRFTVRQLLAPIEQTAFLCGMRYLPPFVVSGTHRMQADEVDRHADAYRRMIEALRDDPPDLDQSQPVLQSPGAL